MNLLLAQATAAGTQAAAENPGWGQVIWDFLTSPVGFAGLGIFLAYLFLWRILGWVFGVLRIGLGKLANIYLFTLAIMVAGVVVYSIGTSWANGTDPYIAAMTSGGIAASVWAVVVLVLHRVFGGRDDDEDETATSSKVKRSRVKPPK